VEKNNIARKSNVEKNNKDNAPLGKNIENKSVGAIPEAKEAVGKHPSGRHNTLINNAQNDDVEDPNEGINDMDQPQSSKSNAAEETNDEHYHELNNSNNEYNNNIANHNGEISNSENNIPDDLDNLNDELNNDQSNGEEEITSADDSNMEDQNDELNNEAVAPEQPADPAPAEKQERIRAPAKRNRGVSRVPLSPTALLAPGVGGTLSMSEDGSQNKRMHSSPMLETATPRKKVVLTKRRSLLQKDSSLARDCSPLVRKDVSTSRQNSGYQWRRPSRSRSPVPHRHATPEQERLRARAEELRAVLLRSRSKACLAAANSAEGPGAFVTPRVALPSSAPAASPQMPTESPGPSPRNLLGSLDDAATSNAVDGQKQRLEDSYEVVCR